MELRHKVRFCRAASSGKSQLPVSLTAGSHYLRTYRCVMTQKVDFFTIHIRLYPEFVSKFEKSFFGMRFHFRELTDNMIKKNTKKYGKSKSTSFFL